MDFEFEDPANAEGGGGEEMDVEETIHETMAEDEDIPVTQEDAWAVIRYGESLLAFATCAIKSDNVP